jgi:hypothetical protein
VVIYGGEKVFAAGADINEMAGARYEQIAAISERLQATFTAIAKIPKPVVAAARGDAQFRREWPWEGHLHGALTPAERFLPVRRGRPGAARKEQQNPCSRSPPGHARHERAHRRPVARDGHRRAPRRQR